MTSGMSRRGSCKVLSTTPGSGYVNDPQLATHNLQRAAEAHGARFLFRAEVVRIGARTAAYPVSRLPTAERSPPRLSSTWRGLTRS